MLETGDLRAGVHWVIARDRKTLVTIVEKAHIRFLKEDRKEPLVLQGTVIRVKEMAHLRIANPRPEILVEKTRAKRREASVVWLPHPAFPVGRKVIPLGQRAWQIVIGVQELQKVVSKRSTLCDMEPKASRGSNGHLLEEEVDSPSILCLKERVGNGVGQAYHQSEIAALGATSSSPTEFFPLHLAVAKRQTSPKGKPQECLEQDNKTVPHLGLLVLL